MSNANVIFTVEGVDVTIQCSQSEKMKHICQKYGTKIEKSINSLIFLYGGNQLNLELSFKDQANSIDKSNNIMKILVYKNENNDYICPKCGEKIKLNTEKISNIITSYENIRETIKGIKLQIENLVNKATISINDMNIQLKNVIIILNSLNDNVQKNNEKLKNLLNDYSNIPNYPIRYVYEELTHKEIKIKNNEIDQNQISFPNVNILRIGSGITKNDQQNIINCAINVYKNKQTPICDKTAKAVKQVLGGDCLVISYIYEKITDFNINMIKGNCYIHFTLENLLSM